MKIKDQLNISLMRERIKKAIKYGIDKNEPLDRIVDQVLIVIIETSRKVSK